ncbi:MAG: hypothetical protein GY772_19345, partial [bacterium]|nr:hypothetical protein [bacterium]
MYERFVAASADLISVAVPTRPPESVLEGQRRLRPPLGENAGTQTRQAVWRAPGWTQVVVPPQPKFDDPLTNVTWEAFDTDDDPALLAWRDNAKEAALAVLELCKPEMVTPLLQSAVEN